MCLCRLLFCEREEEFGAGWGWWGQMCVRKRKNCRRIDGSGELCEEVCVCVCVCMVITRERICTPVVSGSAKHGLEVF